MGLEWACNPGARDWKVVGSRNAKAKRRLLDSISGPEEVTCALSCCALAALLAIQDPRCPALETKAQQQHHRPRGCYRR